MIDELAEVGIPAGMLVLLPSAPPGLVSSIASASASSLESLTLSGEASETSGRTCQDPCFPRARRAVVEWGWRPATPCPRVTFTALAVAAALAMLSAASLVFGAARFGFEVISDTSDVSQDHWLAFAEWCHADTAGGSYIFLQRHQGDS